MVLDPVRVRASQLDSDVDVSFTTKGNLSPGGLLVKGEEVRCLCVRGCVMLKVVLGR
jgi:hypothetical protein